MSKPVLASPYEELTITKEGKDPIRLDGRTLSFDYYESLLSPYVTANINLIDSGNSVYADKKYDSQERLTNLLSGLPITGGEKVSFKISNKYGTLDFTENPLRVDLPSSSTEESNRKLISLHLVSDLAFKNKEATMFPTLSGKISDSVQNIIETYFELPQDRIFISKTSNSYNFQTSSKGPFDILCFLAKRSTPEQGKSGYFCYETKNGLYYVAIDDLANKKYQSTVYNYYRTDVAKANLDNDSNDFKIITHNIKQNSSVLNSLEKGTYVSRNIFLDPNTLKYDEVIFKLSESGLTSSLGKTEAEIPTENSFTVTYSHILDVGTLQSTVSGDVNNSPQFWQAESIMRYNLLFTQIVDMTVPCNLDLKVGDVVICNFESVSSGSKEMGSNDSVQSGNYIILNLCHHFESTRSFSSLTLVRDTYGLYT